MFNLQIYPLTPSDRDALQTFYHFFNEGTALQASHYIDQTTQLKSSGELAWSHQSRRWSCPLLPKPSQWGQNLTQIYGAIALAYVGRAMSIGYLLLSPFFF